MTGPVETPRPLDLRLVPAALAVWAGTLLVLYGGWVSGVVAAGAALLAALACWCWGSGSGLRGSLAVLVLAGAAFVAAARVRACSTNSRCPRLTWARSALEGAETESGHCTTTASGAAAMQGASAQCWQRRMT